MELYQAGNAVRRTGYGRLAVVDFPGGAEADAAAYYAANRLRVEILMPVVNTIDIPKVDKTLYKIHSLGYNKAGSTRIRIVREASISSAAGSPARNPSRWDSG